MLHLAEGGAYNRIEAARAAARFPVIIELFEQSAITLTAIRLLSPHLRADNHAAVLASARHKSKPDILAVIAALSPKPDAPVVVRKLPAPRMTTAIAQRAAAENHPAKVANAVARAAQPPTAEVAERIMTNTASVAVALAPDRYRIQLTVSRETHAKFRRAQDLLRHALPSGDAAAVLDRALPLLIEDLERKRFATTSRPRVRAHAASSARQIPAAVRRTLSKRDEGRCRFIGTSGRCRETAFLEFHHIEPFAAGGAATVDNIELRCRAHNLYEARLFFGNNVVREERASWVTPTWRLVPERVRSRGQRNAFPSGKLRSRQSADSCLGRLDRSDADLRVIRR